MIMVSGQGVLGMEAEEEADDDLVESSPSVLVSIASDTSPSGRSALRSTAEVDNGADDDTTLISKIRKKDNNGTEKTKELVRNEKEKRVKEE
jgi:hypothetical protein